MPNIENFVVGKMYVWHPKQHDDRMYAATKEQPHRSAKKYTTIGTIKKGDIIVVLETTKSFIYTLAYDLKVLLADGCVGWVTVHSNNFKDWYISSDLQS